MSETNLSGRSTTKWRVFLGLIAAVALVPIFHAIFSILLSELMYGETKYRSPYFTVWDEFIFIFWHSARLSSPFVLLFAGLFWFIGHKTERNGLLAASIFGGLTGTIGFVIFCALFGVPLDSQVSKLASSVNLTASEYVEALLAGRVDWDTIVYISTPLVLTGIIVSVVVWCIGYLGRPAS